MTVVTVRLAFRTAPRRLHETDRRSIPSPHGLGTASVSTWTAYGNAGSDALAEDCSWGRLRAHANTPPAWMRDVADNCLNVARDGCQIGGPSSVSTKKHGLKKDQAVQPTGGSGSRVGKIYIRDLE